MDEWKEMDRYFKSGHRHCFCIDLGSVLSGFGIVIDILVTQEMASANDIGHMQCSVLGDMIYTFPEK